MFRQFTTPLKTTVGKALPENLQPFPAIIRGVGGDACQVVRSTHRYQNDKNGLFSVEGLVNNTK